MTAYYTGMIYLTCFAMGIMALIVHSSDWLDREEQRQFQVIFATVAAAAGGNIMALILVFFASGMGMRLCNRQIRADYPCLAFAVMFTYLYYSGVVQNADALTGLRNRRGYDSQLSHLRRPAILLMMDVNRFKAVNDQFGHQYGDRVLQTIARAMQRAYGREGRCYRIGGDEFCVIFDGSQDQARTRTEQFRALLAAEREKLPRLPDVAVGMTPFDPAETDPDSAVKQADREMYENKAAGRSHP